MSKKVVVIGSGFSGLSAAATLAHNGFDVTVVEKNEKPGGRARNFSSDGFIFDMGPTWYWLPDVFERFFNYFGKQASDYYELINLDPAYRMYFSTEDFIDIPYGKDRVIETFESLEPGSGRKLKKFLADAEFKYNAGINKFVTKPSHSILEFMEWDLLKAFFQIQLLRSVSSVVRKTVSDQRLRYILEFPVIFLGSTAANIPALYTLMNWADLGLGTWHPVGGMYSVVEGFVKLATSLGVKFKYDSPVQRIPVKAGRAQGVIIEGNLLEADFVVGGADYHHIEQSLLEKPNRRYSEKYWQKRSMAPSALLFYIGVNKRIGRLLHHNLFFDTNFNAHAAEIYDQPAWPADPALYVSCSSKTDRLVAPDGSENLIVLIPVAPGLEDNQEIKEKYYNLIIGRLETMTGEEIEKHIVFKRMYGYSDFLQDYNSFKGNAYGLANTLLQTAILKPKMRAKNISNFLYTGQLTVPGPGVPPTIISGQVVAHEIIKLAGKQ
jgi:phytoene desaturase